MLSSALSFFNNAVAGAAVQVKAAAGTLYGLKLVNTTAAAAYLQVFGKLAADVVLGTDVPLFAIRLAASESIFIPMPGVDVDGVGISLAGCTTPTGATGAAISVTAFYG